MTSGRTSCSTGSGTHQGTANQAAHSEEVVRDNHASGDKYETAYKTDQADESSHGPSRRVSKAFADYQPVIALFCTAFLGALALSLRPFDAAPDLMPYFMGLALLLFSTLKLFDLKGFQQEYARYDLISSRWPKYGYWYPFIELVLGIGFLTGYGVAVIAVFTIIIMSVNTVGVAIALMNKKQVGCACVGALVDMPLGSFSLIEYTAMVLMAIVLFARTVF